MCCICYILEWSGMFVWPWILANVRLGTHASGAEPQTAAPAPVAYRRLDLKSRHTPFTATFWPYTVFRPEPYPRNQVQALRRVTKGL